MCYCNTIVRSENPLFISLSILTEVRKFRNKIFHQSENLFQSRRWEHATIIRWKRYPRSPLSAEIISWYSSTLNSWFSSRLNSWYSSRLNSWQLQAIPQNEAVFGEESVRQIEQVSEHCVKLKGQCSVVFTTICFFSNNSRLWSTNWLTIRYLVGEAKFLLRHFCGKTHLYHWQR